MRIAVTYEDGEIFQHFGHTQQFKLYDVENGRILSSEVVDTNGSGHGALAGLLRAMKVDALICGGIGGGAQMALAEAGIRVHVLSSYYHTQKPGDSHCLVVNYAGLKEETLEQALATLPGVM